MVVFNDIWNLIFLLLALLGIGLSFYFYKKSQRLKKPYYFNKSINLIKNNLPNIDGLELLYQGEIIHNLTITNFALWNEGMDTINNLDVAPINNLKIIPKDIENTSILAYEIIYIKNKSNNFRIEFSKEQNLLFIDFDYIDKDEGIIFKIYHTGTSNDDLFLHGDIKGTKGFIFKNLNLNNISYTFKKKFLLFLLINLPFILILLAYYYKGNFDSIFANLILWSIINILFFFQIKKRIPEGFQIAAKDF
ncbi:MAG: hypothetical protein ABSF32_11170 [Ignavibacteria bacterium]|jgi:hypothetical protein